MQKLNQLSTKIFCRLLQKLGDKEWLKITVPELLPLVLERLYGNIETEFGKGVLYSLCHYYKLNGDMMRAPELCFIVVDKRKDKRDYLSVDIFPQMFQQDGLGIYEESVCIENGVVTSYIKPWQAGHRSLANLWLKSIAQQKYLK